jgi:hypothetical protein
MTGNTHTISWRLALLIGCACIVGMMLGTSLTTVAKMLLERFAQLPAPVVAAVGLGLPVLLGLGLVATMNAAAWRIMVGGIVAGGAWFLTFLASGYFFCIVLDLDEPWRRLATFGAPTLLLAGAGIFLAWRETVP